MPSDTNDAEPKQQGDGAADEKAGSPEVDEFDSAPATAADPAGETDDAAAEFEESDGTQALDLDDDDIEMLELDEDDMVAEAAPLSQAPPPMPPAAPPMPSAEAGADEGAAEDVEEILDETPPLDGDGDAEAEAPPEPVAEAEVREIESPTALDAALTEADEGDWNVRAATLQKELEETSDRVRSAALAYEIGELYARHLGDEARAVQSFGQALKSDPSLRANLWAIRRVFYRRRLWPNLVKLIDAEIRFVRDNRERASLSVEKGHILQDQLDKAAEAREAYDKALGFDAENVSALIALERIAITDGDEARQLELWRALADGATMPERKLVYLRDLIRVFRTQGEDGLDRAREVLSEALALGVDTVWLARERLQLAILADDPEDMLRAIEASIKPLLDSFGPAGPPEPPQAPRGSGTPLDRETSVRFQVVAFRRRQARIARDQLEDLDRAWAYLEQAMELAPGEPLVVGDLADLAETMGKFEALSGLCLRLQALEPSKERQVALELRRADALVRAGKREDARAHLEGLASQTPGYLPVTSLAERDALAAGDWASLASAITASAQAAQLGTTFGAGGEEDKAGGAAAYVMAGDIYLYYLGDEDTARTRYAHGLELVPGYPPALDALASLHELHGRPAEAAELLELHTEVGDEDFRREVLERLARIYDESGKIEEALGALGRLLVLDPDSDRIRWRMEEMYAALGQADKRAALLTDLAERTDSPDRRAAIQLEVGRIWDEEVDDPGKALAAYRAVLEVWPTDRFTRASVAALLRRSGRWDDLVAERKAEAEQLADGPGVSRALREAGSILVNRLDRPADAVEVYRTLLDRVPTDGHAARALRDALELAGDHDALLEVLERDAEAQTDGAAKASALVRLAEAQLAAERPDDAADAYRRACEADADSPHPWLGSWQLAIRRNDAEGIVSALAHLAAARSHPEVASELYEEAGWAAAGPLDDAARARQAFEHAATLSGGRPGPQIGRFLVDAKQGEPGRQVESLAAMASMVSGAAASAMWLRSAAIREVQGDRPGAGDDIQRAMEAAPDDAGAVVLAAEYFPVEADGQDVARTWRRRAELMRHRAELCDDPLTRDHWDLETAEALERAGQLHDAGRVVGEVLERTPGNIRGLQALRRVCRRGEDLPTLARASLALARVIGDRDGELELLREAANIFDSEPPQVESAVAVYRRILAIEPLGPEFGRLHDIYREHEDQGGLFELLSDRLNVLEDPYQKIPVWLERAQVRRALGDPSGAQHDLEALLEVSADHGDAMRELAGVALALGEAERAAELLRTFLEQTTDPSARADAELELSQILAETMDDPAGAIAQLEGVLQQKPDDVELRERIVALVLRSGDPERAVRELREIERLRQLPAERARDELRIAVLYRDEIHNKDKARASLERARQLDPLNIDAVRELAELAVDPKDRTKILRHGAADARSAARDDPTHGPTYERLAVIGQWLEDDDARYYAASALGALGTIPADHKDFVTSHAKVLRGAWLTGDKPLSADDWRARLRHPRASGFAAELWSSVAEAVARTIPHEPAQLGFGRGDRVGGRHIAREWPRIAALAHVFGVPGFELYVSRDKEKYARVVNFEKPVIYLSSDVAEAKSPTAAFSLGRAMAMARDRSGTLNELRGEELRGVFAAAARIAGVDPNQTRDLGGIEGEAQEERAKAIGKALSRRDKKNLALVSSRFNELVEPMEWAKAVMASSSRAGLLVAGDIDAAFEVLDVGRGGRSLAEDAWALDLLAWAVGDDHLALRDALGLSK